MKKFKNYNNQDCFLTKEQETHISERHPEASLKVISRCLLEPFEVRESLSKVHAHLYYLVKDEHRIFCVVLKICKDGYFISTAYTTNKMKKGRAIYKKEK